MNFPVTAFFMFLIAIFLIGLRGQGQQQQAMIGADNVNKVYKYFIINLHKTLQICCGKSINVENFKIYLQY